ncbi:hypothetical protein [Polynucleobacter necessarius]|uniref:hypothetical protein n=1 Tax=Polynucleobacter necessarius TaxID=576610 RepID=UPI002F95A2FF
MADLGHQVLAIDQDIETVNALSNPFISSRSFNLESDEWPLLNGEFAAIVVTNYLYRPYIDELPKMLQKDGILIYETFAQGNGDFGKPSNPNSS